MKTNTAIESAKAAVKKFLAAHRGHDVQDAITEVCWAEKLTYKQAEQLREIFAAEGEE
jgi:hypothetical protein